MSPQAGALCFHLFVISELEPQPGFVLLRGHWSTEAAQVPLHFGELCLPGALQCLLSRNGPAWPLEALFSELLVQFCPWLQETPVPRSLCPCIISLAACPREKIAPLAPGALCPPRQVNLEFQAPRGLLSSLSPSEILLRLTEGCCGLTVPSLQPL